MSSLGREMGDSDASPRLPGFYHHEPDYSCHDCVHSGICLARLPRRVGCEAAQEAPPEETGVVESLEIRMAIDVRHISSLAA